MLLPLYLAALVLGAAVLVLPVLYFFFGTDLPFFVNDAGTTAPPGTGERVTALLTGLACWGVFLGAFARPMRDAFAFRFPRRWRSRRLGFDAAGVWLAYGNRVLAGIEWPKVAAVSIAEEWREPAAGAYVEVFGVDAAKESGGLLGSLVVTAAPPRPGLRGKRYRIRLECDPTEVRDLIAGLDRFAPGRRVAGGEPR